MGNNGSKVTRREFLSKTSAGVASVGFLGAAGNEFSRLSPKNVGTQEKGKIITRTLGRTGIEVPVVSMGVMNARAPEIVKQSYEMGIRLFDTAYGYDNGRNEEIIGQVIKQLGVRDKVIIQTKIPVPRSGRRRRGSGGGDTPQMSPEQKKQTFLNNVETSLKRLQMEQVDILMIHQPTVEQMNDPALTGALKQMLEEKKTRFIGVSTHARQADVLNDAAEKGFYDVVVTAINCSMNGDKNLLNAIDNAAKKKVGVIAMKTQLKGRSYNDWGPINHSAVLKWVMRHESITTSIPGYTNFDQLNMDWLVASNLEYAAEESEYLEKYDVTFTAEFCQQCEQCIDACPKQADVPTLMRTHMYAAFYANFHQARATLDEIHEEEGILNCALCSSCTARCVNGIDIASNIKDLKEMYV